MSREILLLVDALASEKNVDTNIVFGALEYALAGAVKRQPGHENINVRVSVDRNTGGYQAFRRWLIVEDLDYTYPELEKTIEQIQEEIPAIQIQVGEYYEEPIEAVEFGRIGAQTAKQVILQRIRDAEREQILNNFLQRHENLVTGVVKRVDRYGAVIEVGRLEAVLPRDQMIPRENLRAKDHVRALLLRVSTQGNLSKVILTRTSKEFLLKLFEIEVPEIEEGLIEIKEVARDPGLRSKIAVKSNDARIDPQGTCIGVKGSRINAVTNELNGERIDVVLWSPETAQFVINALSPAVVSRILIDEETHTVDVVVEEHELAAAIGRNGQNVRLATELTGWNLKIMTVAEAEERHKAEDHALYELFSGSLDVDEEIARILVEEGFGSLEEVAYVPVEEMVEIDGFDLELVQTLRARAREAILAKAVEAEEQLKNVDEHLKLIIHDQEILRRLVSAQIYTRDDLADLSTSELVDMIGVSDDEAVHMITQARAHWFNKDGNEGEVYE